MYTNIPVGIGYYLYTLSQPPSHRKKLTAPVSLSLTTIQWSIQHPLIWVVQTTPSTREHTPQMYVNLLIGPHCNTFLLFFYFIHDLNIASKNLFLYILSLLYMLMLCYVFMCFSLSVVVLDVFWYSVSRILAHTIRVIVHVLVPPILIEQVLYMYLP